MTRITNLAPAAGELGSKIKLHGQQLQGDMSQKTGGEGVIAINHVPVNVKDLKWGEKVIEFKLPEKLDGLPSETGVLWLSLLVDGMETNALPFSVVKKV